ncbi:MAG TPA: tetratricopeptide repeat protein, partial [Candidatus Kapabacteria bacterium]|nr:tetratricopeptide repeat protein [Candidatus Kapabacteria bacterium]
MKRSKFIVILLITAAGAFGIFATYNRQQNVAQQFAMPELIQRSAGLSPEEFSFVQKQYADLQKKIANNPNDIDAYSSLAQLFIGEARVTGNHHYYYPAAEKIIDEALRRAPNNFIANATKASILMTYHQFQKAETVINSAITQNQYNAYAYGVLCDAQTELGKYDDAVKTCDKMLSIRPGLSAYARASYQRELHGDVNGAANAMKMAAEAGLQGQENREWALYNLANIYLNQGKLDTAAFLYRGILQERPNYGFALSGLAQVEAARGNYDSAAELLVKASQLTPEHIFLEQLADIYAATGQTESANAITSKVLDAFQQHEKDGWDVDKEYAMFCCNHNTNLPQSLERAKNEYNRRPDNIDALDAYAWALYKNGKASDAIPYIEKTLRLNTANPVFIYHAGLIYNAAGDNAKATQFLQRAAGPHSFLPVIYMGEAQKNLQTLAHKA